MKKIVFIIFSILIASTIVLSIGLGCFYTIKENKAEKTDVEILKDVFGSNIEHDGLSEYDIVDDTWKYDYPEQAITLNIKTSDKYEYSVVSPAIKEKLAENIPNLYYWVEFTCAYWGINSKTKSQLPDEDVIKQIEDSYNLCMAYYKADLLPLGKTQIIYGEGEDSNIPQIILGLWTKEQILNFEENYEKVFPGMYGYISLHFTAILHIY